MLEIVGGGPAMIDLDLDGDVDLFFTGGGTISPRPEAIESQPPEAQPPGSETIIRGLAPALYRNEGNLHFIDVTKAANFTAAFDYSHGCTVTDFNCDGFPDLFVCCYGRSRLYRNRGDGTFDEAADETSLPAPGWGTTAVFADCDRDGLPDLLLARYTDWKADRETPCTNRERIRDVCEPSAYAKTTCLLLHNSGDGSFEDWSERAGFTGRVRGLGTVAADLNGDGWIDFYVASDESPKLLYLGGPQFPLQESAIPAGVALSASGRAEGSMGIAVGDYDGDGLADVFVTNFETEDHALYRNLGNGLFLHSTVAVGLSGYSRMRSGWGAELVDFDGDGWLDIFVLNGSPFYHHGQTRF
ncbi:MAG TPA: VCBS repeat-containing protein, partial [Planctomycetaceae bacterium]